MSEVQNNDSNMFGNVIDYIERHAEITPNKIATIDIASRRSQTYAEMNHRVSKIAKVLADQGVSAGDRVGFYALNSTDIFDIIYACWRIGAISLALNYRLSSEELAYQINDSDPKTLFYDIEFESNVQKLKSITKIKNWIDLDGLGGKSTFEELISNATTLEKKITQKFSDQCLLMYSSGTTGKPKGVIVTHGMMFYSAIDGINLTKLTSDSVSLASMPIFHIGGLNVSCCPVIRIGATVVVIRNFEPGLVLDVIADKNLGIDQLFKVPAAYNALRLHPKIKITDFSRIVTALAGAETVPTSLVEWWHKNKNLKIQEGYGLTESAAAGILIPREDIKEKPGSAGKPLMHMDVKIIQQDETKAGINTSGELLIKGPNITPGYWNNPEATKKSFSNGWFKTGDIGKIDQDGFIYIEDRIDDMYISGGENVYPAEIENILYQIPEIREAAVFGVKDSKWGVTGCAVIVLNENQDLDEDKIYNFCEDKLAKFKIPKHYVFYDILPRGATGKVLKYQLREKFKNKFAESNTHD